MPSQPTFERVTIHCVISPILIDLEVVDTRRNVTIFVVLGAVTFGEYGSLLVRIQSIVPVVM